MYKTTFGPQIHYVLTLLLIFLTLSTWTSGSLYGQISITVDSTTAPSCVDSSNGSINISVNGGDGNYSYSWSGPGFSSTNSDISNLSPGDYTITVTDQSSNNISDTVRLAFNDSVDPIVLTSNFTTQLDANGEATIVASDIDNGSSDNCAIDTFTLSKSTFTCADVGPNSVTLTVTDVNGNSASDTAIVTVEDKVAPVVTTQNITVQLDASGNATIAEDAVNNGSSDACGSLTYDTDITTFNCSNIGVNTVTLTVTDTNGNLSSKTATVTVEDKVAPVVTTQNITVQLDASGNATIAEDAVNNGSSDACGGLTYETNITSFNCSNIGANTVTLTVTDTNGNSVNKTATVTVEDKVAPVVITQNITVQLDASGNATIAEDAVNNGSSDACGGLTYDTNITSFNCSNIGVNTVTLAVTDTNGNSVNKTATVTVEDKVVPVVITQNITVQLDASGNATIAEDAVNNGSSDACGGLTYDTNNTSFNCSNIGANTVTLTVTDTNGNSSSKTATVTVEDKVAPVVTTQNITVQLDASGNATIPEDAVNNGSSDACGGLTYDTNITSFNCSNIGVNTVTLTVTDTNGNSANKTATVTVEDLIVPVITSVSNITSNNSLGDCGTTLNIPNPGATDNCNFPTPTGTRNDGLSLTEPFPVGTTIITWNVTDDNNNAATPLTQTITVIDNEAPVITHNGDKNVNIEPGKCHASVTVSASANDNCNVGNPTSTRSDGLALAQPYPVGTTTITWNVTDANGNDATPVTQTVIVTDNEIPVITHDGTKTVNNETGTCEASVTVNASVTDNCTVSSPVGTRSDGLTLAQPYPVGTTTITWNVTDDNGNKATAVTQKIVVKDNEAPDIPVLNEIISQCTITIVPPTTSDNCDAIVSGTTGDDLTLAESGSIFWIFTDSAGNPTEPVEQIVTIADTQAPEPNLSSLPRKTLTGCQISNISELDIPLATDACEGEIEGKLSDDFQFPYSFFGVNTVTWEFIDSSGNISTQQQEIQLNPVTIEGGTLKGTFNNTEFQEQIDISSCGANISVDLNLSGKSGNIVQWEKFAVNKGFWEIINNTSTSFTANFAAGAFESTYFRVLVKSGTCTDYSNSFYIRALPAGDAPTVTNLDDSNKYCLGDDVNLLAESNYLATQPAIPSGMSPGDFNQGQLNTQDPNSWLVDGDTGGFTAGGNSKKPRNWSGTNDHEFGDIEFDSEDGKFAIAQGDFSDNKYKGANPTTLESPILDLSQAASASLEFDQAFYFANNDIAIIQVSTDGGNTYSTLRLMHGAGTGVKKWFTAGTAQSTTGSSPTRYLFKSDNTTISLDDYVGENRVRIRWLFKGTSDNSVWAMDNIFINNQVPVDTELEWTEGIGNPEENPIETGQTSIPLNFTPATPGIHQYGATALINGCRTYDEDGTDLIDIYVSYSYAGEDIIQTDAQCGNNTIQLNAYDNSRTASENAEKGAYPTIPENCTDCDIPGTGDVGTWSWAGDTPSCTEASFSDINDPDATFTAGPGIYVLTWTVDGCSHDITVKITDCTQVDFDGTDDYVNFGDNYNLSGAFSLEVWVKPENLSGRKSLLSKRDSNFSGTAKGYDLRIENGIVAFHWDKTGNIISPKSLSNTNRWYHIAVTHTSNGEYRLYVDGIVMKLTGGAAPSENDFNAILGAMENLNQDATSNYFNGWMEELRIWKVALTEEQIHLMMNQHIIESGSGKVIGEILPLEIDNLSWNSLEAYYRMDNISCGSLNAYSTDGIIFKGTPGKLNNITSPQQTTAPLPYISKNNGAWENMNTWLHPDVWDAPNSKGINDESINWNIVVSEHDITSSNRNISLLGLLSENGELKMEGTVNMDNGKGSGNGLSISHYLRINGIINLEGESQLIQSEGSVLDEASSGYIDVDQQGTANSFNYNYWTSPVSLSGQNSNSGYTIKDVLKDATNPSTPQNINFDYQFHWADGNYTGNKRISSYWLHTFKGNADDYSEWHQFSESEILEPGIGFSMKGTTGYVPVNNRQNYTFRGKPNNGNINVAISTGQNLLTGNPYPSAIDAQRFIEENLGSFNGSLYFWDHFGPVNSHYLEEYVGGYAVYNLSGGIASASSIDSRIDETGDRSTKAPPARYIPVGQAFFVSSTGVSSPSPLIFKNKYRAFVPESSGDSQFHSQEKDLKKTKENEYEKDSRFKIRLKFESPKGYHRQILVTADAKTTGGFDLGYDAPLIENNVEDMYWMIDDTEFIIQAVPDFNLDQVLPLGIKISQEGIYTIKIDELENIETEEIDIYLKDKLNNTYFDLIEGDYTATAEELGNFNERYEIVFKSPEEDEDEDDETEEEEQGEGEGEDEDEESDNPSKPITEKPEVLEPVIDDPIIQLDYLKSSDEISLYNPDLMKVDFVELYSISGQKIMTFTEVPTQESLLLKINQKISSAVYILKLYSGEKFITKKVIISK